MKSWIVKLLLKIAFKAATDKNLRAAVVKAVSNQEGADKNGADKMKGAIEAVRKESPAAFVRAGKKQVRMMIEAELSDLLG